MKLTRLYCNKPEIFSPISFNPGLNVILAEIRLPENKNKDTHNLGKTTLGRLIDFCLLTNKKKEDFLFKHQEIFKELIFFLEIEISNDSYITIKRGVSEPSKVSFLFSSSRVNEALNLPEKDWNHKDVPLDTARHILDGRLGWIAIKPRGFRQLLTYLIRSQNGYKSPFRPLGNYQKAQEWKPFVSQLIGLNSHFIENKYKLQDEYQIVKNEYKKLPVNLEYKDDISKVEGLKSIQQDDLDKLEKLVENINFSALDIETAESLVKNLDVEISSLNGRLYNIGYDLEQIDSSLKKENFLFDPGKAEELFKDAANIIFPKNIKKSYEDLIKFNKEITSERISYLQKERNDLLKEKSDIENQIKNLNKERSEKLIFLKEKDILTKYKKARDEISLKKDKINELNVAIQQINARFEKKNKLISLQHDIDENQSEIQKNIADQSTGNSLFSTIRSKFTDIIEKVLDRKALIYVNTDESAEGGLEFKAELISEDGSNTDEAKGHSYTKILCVAFDLALLISHLNQPFPKFVFHDGAFEGLDDRKKENLKAVIDQYCKEGIQYIVTTLDSDLPHLSSETFFKDDEVIVKLHDQGKEGRLFHIETW